MVVVELPYGVSKAKIIEQIADLSRKGKIDEVSELRDESDRDGMRLVVELKRGSNAKRVLQTLLGHALEGLLNKRQQLPPKKHGNIPL